MSYTAVRKNKDAKAKDLLFMPVSQTTCQTLRQTLTREQSRALAHAPACLISSVNFFIFGRIFVVPFQGVLGVLNID
jgi:hypothetical protein